MNGVRVRLQTVPLPEVYDVLAPDTSEIRLLGRVAGASMAHGTLPPGGVSLAVVHRTVEEIWYVLEGEAEIWRKLGNVEATIAARAGTSITIPVGTHFQFRTVGPEPFRFIMCTVPPWPGEDEAARVPDHWPASRGI
jgi:mannose-6-phosphate isomerase-like protein (cupin superfamily)